MNFQPYNPFGNDDGDKSNDSSFNDGDGGACVSWANTQSPGNRVLAEMLNEAYSEYLFA